jgi:hypothetical protein
VTIGPQAVIGGDLRLGGGTVQVAESAKVQGERVRSIVPLPLDAGNRAAGWDGRLRGLAAGLLLAAMGGLAARQQPQLLANVGQTAVKAWLVAGAVGLLVILVLPVLLVLMAFTIILLPAAAIVAGLSFLLLGYGFCALGGQLGSRLARMSGRAIAPGWATFGGTLLLLLLFNLPFVGELLVAGAAVLVLGALLLTGGGLRRYDPPALLVEEDVNAYRRQR